jgi:hypothetical protein
MKEIKLLANNEQEKKLFVRMKEIVKSRGEHTHLEFYDENGKELFYMQFTENVIGVSGPLSTLNSPNMDMVTPATLYRRY